jgi:hypothetical protein
VGNGNDVDVVLPNPIGNEIRETADGELARVR